MDKVIWIVIIVVLVTCLKVWGHRRQFCNWAEAMGFDVVSTRFEFFHVGPYTIRSKHQTVFRIKVSDVDGRIREGWACCGGFWLGLPKVDVTWDRAKTRR